MRTKTHKSLILKQLQRGHGVTHITALRQFGCARLAARINELREDGHKIITKMVSRNGARYAQYIMP